MYTPDTSDKLACCEIFEFRVWLWAACTLTNINGLDIKQNLGKY